MTVALYPGTFDPLTNGHLDLIQRSARLFERVIVALFDNPRKGPLFAVEERCQLIAASTADLSNITITTFSNTLLVFLAQQQQAQVLVRGLRAVTDFDYEMQMTLMNRRLAAEIETVFFMPREEYSYVSSSLIKEVVAYGGNIEALVPPPVARALQDKFRRPSERTL